MKTNTRIVATYSRVSTEEQSRSGYSLEAQDKSLNGLASYRWPGARVLGFTDVGTGRNDKRPSYRALMKAVDQGEIAVVLAMSIDRLWRNVRDGLDAAQRMERTGTDLVLHGSGVDTTSAVGKAFFSVLLAFSELESNRIGERTALVHRMRRASGRKGPGLRPYGWKVGDDKILIPDEGEQKVIQLITIQRQQGQSWREICHLLNRLGHPTVTGKEWVAGSLQSMHLSALGRLESLADPNRVTDFQSGSAP